MAEYVSIIVRGETGSGKSALLGEIEILLRALKVSYLFENPTEAQSVKNLTGADWVDQLEKLKPTVLLIEQNVPPPKHRYLPCPICNGVEGCDHSYPERKQHAKKLLEDPLTSPKLTMMRFDPRDGLPMVNPITAEAFRNFYGSVAFVYNPYTGEMRDPRDIGSDTFGHLIIPPFQKEST